jgi:hypothetical protein
MRRHLGYTPAEVDAMTWAERRMWVEMLNLEFSGKDEDGEPEAPVQHTDDLTSLGFNVTNIA